MDFTTFILTLLSGNWVFFNDDEIVWDGEHHQITGLQVNGAQADGFMDFVNENAPGFDDIQDVLNYFVAFLNSVESDDALIVPREAIAPEIQQALRQGDLTGITLANLAACGAAFQVNFVEEDLYSVYYDMRLGLGIPSFFDLIARLLWDLRQGLKSTMGRPFAIVFNSTRNVDADEYLGDLDKMVLGAQRDPISMEIESCPEVDLKLGGGLADGGEGAGSGSFASGFDFPTEIQADEELFESDLLSLARTFPLILEIEGTHVLGRAERIESVKVGDGLVLAADWQTPFFDPVGIEVFNQDGETLGYLRAYGLSGNRELACLLPFSTATVDDVTPVSQRGKNARHALMKIRIELDEEMMRSVWCTGIDESVLKEAKALLARPKPQRVVLSHTDLSPQQLEGAIDTSEALENPFGSLTYNGSSWVSDDDSSDADAAYEADGEAGAEDDAEDSDLSEREQMLALLQLFVMSGQLGGTEFPQELLDRLERAVEGDESIDIDELAEQLNNATPDIQSADLGSISFSQGNRVDGRRFSIAVPDGWSVLKDVEENNLFMETVRPFAIVPHEAHDGDDISLSDRIVYSDLSGDLELSDSLLEIGTPAFKWACMFLNAYDKSGQLGALKPTYIWDEEVDAVNTKCFVAITEPRGDVNGVEFYIYPYAMDHSDFLKGVFTYDESAGLDQLKEFVVEIAKTVQLDDPIRPGCEVTLEAALNGKISSDEFDSMVECFARPFMNMKQQVFDAGKQKYLIHHEDAELDDILLAGAQSIVDFAARAIPAFSELLDAYDKQVQLGASAADQDMMKESLEAFNALTFPTPELFSDDPESFDVVDGAGVFDPSPELQRCQARLAELTGDEAWTSEDDEEPGSAGGEDEGSGWMQGISAEDYVIDAYPKIIAAFGRRLSADEYVSISEAVGFEFMQKRQGACDVATNPFASDEDNVTAMSREFGRFNPIIARYVGYMLDLIEAQKELGASSIEVAQMVDEAEELMSLIVDTFSCGNPYLDAVANANAPIDLPYGYGDLKRRFASMRP